MEGRTRREYYGARAIENLAARYCVPPSNLAKIAAKLRKDLGVHCGVDERGAYYITNLNPNGKYDYWTLHNFEADVWRARNIPPDRLPSAMVTTDGQWPDTGREER